MTCMIPSPVQLQSDPESSIAVSTETSLRSLRQQEENALVAERLRVRDPQILDELILRYQHRLLRYLMYLTGNRELAEDLFQETWMRVLVRGAQFRGNSQFVTWLFSIARNLALDSKRRRPAMASFEDMTETGDERWIHYGDEPSAFDYCAAVEDARLAEQVIPALTREQREVILLRFREEMPLQEIAAVTRAPLSTVKARLYRGLAVLKSRMLTVRNVQHRKQAGARSAA